MIILVIGRRKWASLSFLLCHSRKLLAGIHPNFSFSSPIEKMDTRHKPRV